ncbi:MAG: HAMP domain-containing sensor histidine kinase [Rhodocyclaceae bacterium]|nr:HAMP domain-containing sensor histidine kinase [Rhodocyclaceae bacterium]
MTSGSFPVRTFRLNLYPRSFLQLILLGNVLVALPLLAVIGYASLKLDDLARRSGEAMRQASQAASLGRSLPEDLERMERSLRQYEVLRDPSLLDDYAAARRDWRKDSAAFAAIPLTAPLAGRLDALRQGEEAAYARLGKRAAGLAALKTAVIQLKQGVHPLLAQASRLADAEDEAFRAQTESLRRHMQVAEALAVAAAGFLLWWGRRLTVRLWSRFERAVLALGEGRLDRRIRLKGPEDLQRVGRRLEWLRRRLKALEEQRTLVLRHVSHELKTPLAAMREGTALLTEGAAGALTAPQAKIVDIMHGNVLRQQTLIEGLLKLQQAGFAGERFEPQPVRLDALVEQVLATHQLVARNKHLHLSASLAPLEVAGGRDELTTIVDNLVANAIKFTPDDGHIAVSVSGHDGQAALDVVDDGPGIPAADRDRIFEPFYRGQATRGEAGVGLGLAISHQFARAHRGDLTLLEAPAGAHFRLTLPLLRAAP